MTFMRPQKPLKYPRFTLSRKRGGIWSGGLN